jgi:hypothetical protein
MAFVYIGKMTFIQIFIAYVIYKQNQSKCSEVAKLIAKVVRPPAVEGLGWRSQRV